jgi:serine/threonine protein kinase
MNATCTLNRPMEPLPSWRSSLLGSSEILAGINKAKLARLTHDIRQGENASMPSEEPQRLEATIRQFVEHYRGLPLNVRAKVEKWSIDPADILVSHETSNQDRFTAMYHGTQVKVKILKDSSGKDGDTSSQICQEIAAIAQIRHPNVVGFLGASMSGDSCLVVTELMGFDTLYAMFQSERAHQPSWTPTRVQTLSWSLDLVRAANYLHQSDPVIVHQALRPDNLCMSRTGQLKLAWLSSPSLPLRECIAQDQLDENVDTQPNQSFLCRSNASVCSNASSVYDAPELRRGACADPSADIYSIAMVIWFLRTGRDPAPAPASCLPMRVWSGAKGSGDRPSTGAVGWRGLAAVVAQAWAERAEERPTADGLTGALEALQGERGGFW